MPWCLGSGLAGSWASELLLEPEPMQGCWQAEGLSWAWRQRPIGLGRRWPAPSRSVGLLGWGRDLEERVHPSLVPRGATRPRSQGHQLPDRIPGVLPWAHCPSCLGYFGRHPRPRQLSPGISAARLEVAVPVQDTPQDTRGHGLPWAQPRGPRAPPELGELIFPRPTTPALAEWWEGSRGGK